MGIPVESVNTLKARHMVAKKGMHPDFVAEKFGFTSGDELVRKLAFAPTPQELIESLADERMLEAHGELATPEAIERAADEAVHNEARGRAVATELAALVKATGETRVLTSAARQFAAAAIARLPVRQLKPGMFSNAQARAARESKAAMGRGDVATAAAQKRNERDEHRHRREDRHRHQRCRQVQMLREQRDAAHEGLHGQVVEVLPDHRKQRTPCQQQERHTAEQRASDTAMSHICVHSIPYGPTHSHSSLLNG